LKVWLPINFDSAPFRPHEFQSMAVNSFVPNWFVPICP
jgi:hypothetical protein